MYLADCSAPLLAFLAASQGLSLGVDPVYLPAPAKQVTHMYSVSVMETTIAEHFCKSVSWRAVAHKKYRKEPGSRSRTLVCIITAGGGGQQVTQRITVPGL